MTVSSETTRVQYACNGATISFAYPFRIFADSDLLVIRSDAAGNETAFVLNSDYTVTGAGDAGGGSITIIDNALPPDPASKVPSGYKLTLMRNLAYTQAVDYGEGDAFPAESHELALDRLTMLVQQTKEQLDRALRVKRSSTLTTPIADEGAGYYLRWNAAGTAVEATAAVNDPGSFTQSGTGTVSRSVTSKLGEIVSVKDFGAVGNGVADDTAAIHYARDSVGTYGTIVFPLGTYLVSGLTANIAGQEWVIQKGATIKDSRSGSGKTISVTAAYVKLSGGGRCN